MPNMVARVATSRARRLAVVWALVALLLPTAPGVADSPWDVPVTPVNPAEHLDDPVWVRAQADALARSQRLV